MKSGIILKKEADKHIFLTFIFVEVVLLLVAVLVEQAGSELEHLHLKQLICFLWLYRLKKNDESINNTATTVATLLRNVAAPLGPKRVCDEPPPKAGPSSAPLPL